MTKALYIIGGLAIAVGALAAFPSLGVAVRAGDPLMVLGAPIVMNAITLALFGTLLLFLGRVLALMERVAQKTIWLDAWEADGKVLIKCPSCAQQLRVASGKTGSVNCPKCGNKFPIAT